MQAHDLSLGIQIGGAACAGQDQLLVVEQAEAVAFHHLDDFATVEKLSGRLAGARFSGLPYPVADLQAVLGEIPPVNPLLMRGREDRQIVMRMEVTTSFNFSGDMSLSNPPIGPKR